MSEYAFVEKPFLDQLAALGWRVIDQGTGVPTDPTKSHRTSFREVILKDIFHHSVRAINITEDGRPWLTDVQIDELVEQITHQPGKSLVEVNEEILRLLYRTQIDVNEVTGEEYPNVRLIDFYHPERHHFLAINQFRIDTSGAGRAFIIPDIVLFVNGLPLVVKCKDANIYTANPMYEAFRQLLCYSDQRAETRLVGLREGEPRLFYTNQLLIRTCGEQAEFGTITSTDEDFFFGWKDIYAETYRNYTPPLGTERAQERLIQGMLPPATLLDIVRNATLFMEVDKMRVKIVCRYQQYRALCKIIDHLRTGKTPAERSGVIWHTQGSGKSLTMVFVIRKLRMCDDLKDLKICLINDRRDLEDQLRKTAALTGEKVTTITTTSELKTQLATATSNLNMVMVHKFWEHHNQGLPDYLESVLERVPTFERFGLVNPSERILLMIDETQCTQSGDLGDNLFEAFPNATRLAFTGTPLIVLKDRQKTVERFGDYIDKYKLQDAVADGTTVQILYEGKTADAAIDRKYEFDMKVEEHAAEYVTAQLRKAENIETLQRIAARENRLFDDLVRERTAEEILALKKKWGTSGDLLEAEERIAVLAADLVDHYIDNILPYGFKAQVVCNSKLAAVRYKSAIDKAMAARLAHERARPVLIGEPRALPEDKRQQYRDEELCRKIAFLKSAVVISSDGTNESAAITEARRHARAIDAVENFKRAFDYDDPDKTYTGIAFLIVCDMLLTGFDAPIEQVMYIDKKVQAHTLLQTIARVNRVAKGKTRGYIVDYIRLARHLQEALSIYAADDQQDLQGMLHDISVEVPVLEGRYRRLLHLFRDNGVAEIERFVQQTITDSQGTYATLKRAIEAMADLKQRENFEVYLKAFMQSLDIILPNAAANPYKIPTKRFGDILTKVKQRYKDDSLNLSDAGEKVKQLIDEHLISLGINPKIPPIELLSPNFLAEVEKNQASKAKASEMEHAIRKYTHIHFDEDPAFYTKLSDKLEALIRRYKDDWEALYRSLFDLRQEVAAGRGNTVESVSAKAAPFYDLIGQLAFGSNSMPDAHADTVKRLASEVMALLQRTITIVNFWNNGPEVSKLKGALADLILFTRIDAVIACSDALVTEVTALAKVHHRDIVS